MKVLVLGGTGMLGSMVAKVIPDEWETTITSRSGCYPYDLNNAVWQNLAVGEPGWIDDLDAIMDGCEWTVNCIGATKPLLPDEGVTSTTLAVYDNIVLPIVLAEKAAQNGCKVIQIATDCVFLGTEGPYSESDERCAADLYGRTKALGEVPGIMHLRCSIVGPEVRFPARNLLGKVVEGLVTKGWKNHDWNGVTTLAFAKTCIGIMQYPEAYDVALPATHLVPKDILSKAELIDAIVDEFNLGGGISYIDTPTKVDLSLSTERPNVNERLWEIAGYSGLPTIDSLIIELAEYCRQEMWPPPGCDGWRCWRE